MVRWTIFSLTTNNNAMNSTNPKKTEDNDRHERQLQSRTKDWGKTKFKPKKYVQPKPALVPQATATPWQHVKNDIITDSSDRGHQDVDSEDARQFMQQRQKNHRRNVIEANRSQDTTWEPFNDEKPSTERKQQLSTDVENFTFKERNFFRKQLTLGFNLTKKNATLKSALKDLKYRQLTKDKFEFERSNHTRRNVKSSNAKEAKGSHPFQKMRDNAHPYRKKGPNRRNPFQKGPHNE